MQLITASEYSDWASNPVTKAFKLAIAESIARVKENLAVSAGLDPNEDNFFRGYIRAMYDTLDFRVEDLQESGE